MSNSKNLTVADVFLRSLDDHGIEYIFANAGTDFAPIIEALVKAAKHGQPVPRFITVPHENVAISMAQGYYRISGKTAGVMVHVTVGTANTICGLMNSFRDNIPVLLMAGRTPLTETGDIGSRNVGIHWGQENFDQGGMVREFVKWDYELKSAQPVDKLVGRALDIANSEPCGPVYLTLPREVLGHDSTTHMTPRRYRALGSSPNVPNLETINTAADLIFSSNKPILITGKVGARKDSFETFGKFANKYGIPIGQVGDPCLLSDHPMNLGFSTGQLLSEADLVLVVESSVPWIPRIHAPKANSKLIHISPDPFYSDFPFRGFEMDLAVSGEPIETIKMLHKAMASKFNDFKDKILTRKKLITKVHKKLDVARQTAFEEASGLSPISTAWVATCLNEAKPEDAIIVNELGVNVDHLLQTSPNSYVSGGQAGGLGYGLGMALGAKLAEKDRDVILVVGDGSYIFGNPTAAHFVGRAENLATLTIIMNNKMWFAVHRSTKTMYPDGLAVKSNRMPLTELSPSPDFEKTIEACGGYGERIEDPALLKEAIIRGLEKVRNGQSVLLNVMTQPGR